MNKTYNPAIRNGKPVLVEENTWKKPDPTHYNFHKDAGKYVAYEHVRYHGDVDRYENHVANLEVLEVSPELLEAMPEWWYQEQGFEYDIPITVLRPEGYTGIETLVEGVDFNIIPTAVFIEGHYSNTCISCQKLFSDTDKKWLICKNCSEKPIAVPLPTVKEEAKEPVETAKLKALLAGAHWHGWFMRERYGNQDKTGHEPYPENWKDLDYDERETWFFEQWYCNNLLVTRKQEEPLTNAQVREQLYKLLPLFLIQNCQYNDGERLLVKRLVQSFEPVNPEFEKYNEEHPGHGLPNQKPQ